MKSNIQKEKVNKFSEMINELFTKYYDGITERAINELFISLKTALVILEEGRKATTEVDDSGVNDITKEALFNKK